MWVLVQEGLQETINFTFALTDERKISCSKVKLFLIIVNKKLIMHDK